MAVFQRLSQATERFRPDEWRRDPAFLKIWLAYLEAHLELYGDLEEVRRLFRFLKSEHIGLDQAEFHLHQAQLEICSGKPEKCLAILETAAKNPALASNEQLRRAVVEFKLVGSFRLDSLFATPADGGSRPPAPATTPFTPQSSSAGLCSEGRPVSDDQRRLPPPPTLSSSATAASAVFPGYSLESLDALAAPPTIAPLPPQQFRPAVPSARGGSSSSSLAPPPTPTSQAARSEAKPDPSAPPIMATTTAEATIMMTPTPLDTTMMTSGGGDGQGTFLHREALESRRSMTSRDSAASSQPSSRAPPPQSSSLPPAPASSEPAQTNSAFTTRIRRLGNLGPPKRAIVSPLGAADELSSPLRLSPRDPIIELASGGPSATTKAAAEPAPLPPRPSLPMALESAALSSTRQQQQPSPTDSVINSPSKHSRMEMTIDRENMSLTTISPTRITQSPRRIRGEAAWPGEDGAAATGTSNNALPPPLAAKSRAVRVNGRAYKVLQMIGRGGSSRVFKVLAADNTILALKKVGLRNLDESTLNGYLNEIDLLRSFKDSPHIIKLVDCEINREHGNLYMLMEFGEADLGRLLRDAHKGGGAGGGPSINFIRYMWQQMLQAVMAVHAAKIVHCDLKPANFLLVGGVLKLIDFGISKAIMNDTTNIVRENQVGTVNYMSPEALQESSSGSERGRIKIGRASDVWSLGCILYEMVYGKPPFAQFSLIQRLHKILDTAYEIPFGPLEDGSLLDAMRTCLQRAAKRRPTLEELLTHPFLKPHAIPSDSVVVSRRQLVELMEKFSKHISQLDVGGLADKIFLQWSRESAAPRPPPPPPPGSQL